ncbi:hypothetical protein GALL_544670 [mine drainage metagenome]|uniref:Uncharacterized protein n=1 Tax=mine drainage metagenome TaxID=410659 RepID=A0A1J5P0B5_9ZZZZ
MAGSALACKPLPSTATVTSSPAMNCSHSTASSSPAASAKAPSHWSAACTLLRPMVEPSRAGLTIIGPPNCAQAAWVAPALLTVTQAGVGNPSARHRRLVMILSMPMLEAMTPAPV